MGLPMEIAGKGRLFPWLATMILPKAEALLGGELTQADGVIDLSGPQVEGLELGCVFESGRKRIDQIVEREFIDLLTAHKEQKTVRCDIYQAVAGNVTDLQTRVRNGCEHIHLPAFYRKGLVNRPQ